MKNILVTGGAGFIGTNFVYYRLNKYPEDHIVVIDALTYAGNRKNMSKAEKKPKFKFVRGNILDQDLVESLLTNHKIDTIIHFAAESHVDRSITGPDEFINTNIVGTHCLLKSAKKMWISNEINNHRFHHISTDEVYGTLKPADAPFSETTAYAPNSPYAASKAASDHLVRAYHKTYGLNVTTSNCSNNYGPFQFPEKLIPLTIAKILEGEPIPIYGDGKQIRDWLYVDDHNMGIDLILDKGKSGETYNIGGNNEKTNLAIVNLICKEIDKLLSKNKKLASKFHKTPFLKGLNSNVLIKHIQDRPGHDRRYAINAEKITSQLGYKPNYTLEEGMIKTIKWFVENADKKIISTLEGLS